MRSMLLLSLLAAPLAQAQVQRTLVNLGFEQPALGAPACFRFISETIVPGWTTDHPVIATQTVTCDNVNIPGAPTTGRAMEFWTNGFNATPSRNGVQHVELNASASSRLSQSVCLVNGEEVNWVFSHRGRGSATVQDVMSYLVGAAQIVRVGTTSTGAGGVLVTSQGTAGSVPGPNGWRDYSGSFTYTGATGTSNLGFQSISTAGGNNSVGNFLDDIQIRLRPFVEFVQATDTKAESTAGNDANIPRIRVSGTVPAGGMTVVVNITGGTATLGSDFTTPGNSTTLNVAVPAGVYDGVGAGSQFVLPVTLIADAVPEPDETITFALPTPAAAPPPYLLASTVTCGGSVLVNNTLTITDSVARMTLAKSVVSRPVGGSSGFTISIDQAGNPVASASTGLGSGVANNTATTGERLVTPGVVVSLSEVLQAGGTHAFNQFDASIACVNSAAGSTTVLPTGLASSGSWNLTPAADDQIACTISNSARAPTVTVIKSVGTRANASDQFTVGVLQLPATVLGSATTVGAGSTATTGPIALPSLTDSYRITDAMAAGSPSLINQYTAGISCNNARSGASAAVPVTGSAPSWGFAFAAGDIITCTVSNTRTPPRLVLSKALAGARLSPTDQFRMAIAGPGGGNANTTGAGSTVSGGTVTVATATPGTAYTLSETMVAGSATPLANYSGSLNCTNSRTGEVTVAPGNSSSLTPLAGDNFTCVLTNTPSPAALSVTKSNAQASYTPGGSAIYVIVVSNTGTGPALGATVSDPLPAGVTLSAPWTCSASAGSSCSASGGVSGGSLVSLSIDLLAGGTATISVPVSFSPDAVDY